MSEAELIKTAHHEAGHAVVGAVFGEPLREVSIVADHDFAGITRNDPSNPYEHTAGEDAWLMNCAISFYAGHAATLRLGYDEAFEEAGAYDDYFKAAEACGNVAGLDAGRTEELQEFALKHAQLIVDTHWSNIVLVANMLLKEKTISGDQVKAIVEASGLPNKDELVRYPFAVD